MRQSVSSEDSRRMSRNTSHTSEEGGNAPERKKEFGAATATAAAVVKMPHVVEIAESRSGCCRCMMRKDDSPEDRRMKRVLTPVLLPLFALCAMIFIGWAAGLNDEEPSSYYLVANGIVMLACGLFFAGAVAGFDMGKVLDVSLVVLAVAYLAQDLRQKALLKPALVSIVVIILDMAILFARDRISPIVITLTFCYFFAERVEASFRLGLYELVDEKMTACDCAEPPCSEPFIASFFFISFWAFVLVFDYVLTHRFASDLRKQLSRLEEVAIVSEEVTTALARYDVAAATRALATESATAMPAKMRQAFDSMLVNLHQFKAALPIEVIAKTNRAVINTEEMTEEEPQFDRLFELFGKVLEHVSTGPFREVCKRLVTPQGIKSSRILKQRARGLPDKVKSLSHLGLIELLVLDIYTMEDVDIDRCMGYDAPEWKELRQYGGTEEERLEAVEIWDEFDGDGEAATRAAQGRSPAVQKLIELFRGGLLSRIDEAQKNYKDYKCEDGNPRNGSLYKAVCRVLRTLQGAEGSVAVFLDAFNDLLSQGLINYIGVLCCCPLPGMFSRNDSTCSAVNDITGLIEESDSVC
eukprot:Hpha_TRINITY_DN17023_c0_g1::TRINITY_DN17023_c0_g1_i1::g.166636::m.166636